MSIGDNLKKIRKNKKMTQQDFGKLVGLSTNTVQRYELGKRQPNIETITKIAEALEVPVNELLNPISTEEMIQNSISKSKESPGSIGKCFAVIENKKEQEINLLYNLLKIRYGEENMNINHTIDDEFIELTIGDKNIVYTKQDFEKFIDHVSNLFPTFKMILDNSKTK